MIVRFGGVLGIGTRPIAVPVEAVALMGEYVAILDFTPDQLAGFSTASERRTVPGAGRYHSRWPCEAVPLRRQRMQSPLNEALDARRSRMNADQQQAYQEFLERLDAGQVAEHALKAGDRMPEFLLPSAEGMLVHSDALLARGPLVVTFFRGGWCPYCGSTLDALEAVLPDLTGGRGHRWSR